MDKGLRNQIAQRLHKKRCDVLGLDFKQHYCYKAQGKPCSCWMCTPEKFKRARKHKGLPLD